MALDTIVVDYQLELGNLKSQISDLANQFKTLESSGKKSAESLSDAYRKEGGIVNNLKADIIELEKAQSKANNPADVAAYTKKLEESRNKMKELTTATKEVHEQHSKLGDIVEEVGTKFAAVFAVEKVIEFGKASLEAYNEAADGEAKLLNALKGRQDVAERLIKQANELQGKTTVKNDAIVAQQAFLAAQGRTEDQIKKTIQAALQLSAVTGEDLNSAVVKLDATYEGNIGRLGKLDKAFKDLTPSQLAAGGAIDLVNKKYIGFAESAAKTGSGPLKQLGNAFNDFQEKLGGGISKAVVTASNGLKSLFELITQSSKEVAPDVEELGNQFREQSSKVENLQKNINPLLDRYDVLKSKSSLNKGEQTELNDIIKKVSDTIPQAITQFDAYGKAMDINTGKARDNIKTEQARLKVVNESAIKARQEEAKTLEADIQGLQKRLQAGTHTEYSGFFDQNQTQIKDTSKEIQDNQQKLADLQEKLKGTNAELDYLTGKALDPAKGNDSSAQSNSIVELKKQLEDATATLEKAEIGTKAYNDALANQKDLQDQITKAEGKQTDSQKKQAEQDKKDAEDKKKTLQLEIQLREELQQLQGKSEIDPVKQAMKERDAAKQALEDKYKDLGTTQDVFDAEAELEQIYQNKLKDIKTKTLSDEQAAEAKADKDAADQRQSDFNNAKNIILGKVDVQKQALEKQYADGKLSKEQYEAAINALDKDSLKQQLQAAQQFGIDNTDLKKQQADIENKLAQSTHDKKIALQQQEVDLAKQAGDAAFDIAKNLSQGRLDTLDKEHQDELDKLDKQKAAKKISDKEYTKEKQKIDEDYNKKASAEKTKQAKLDKEKALFDIAINTASGIIKALPDPVLAGIVAAAGIVEASVVASKPIPKFARGTEYVKGGTRGQDSVHAMLMPYEAVIPVKENERHHDAVKSILADKHDKDYVSVKKYNKIRENLNYYMAEGKKRETDAAAFREMNYKLQIIQKNQFDTAPIVQAISRPQQLDDRSIDKLANKLNQQSSQRNHLRP